MRIQVAETKKTALAQIEALINAFDKDLPLFKQKSYNEAQLRIDFLNPFLKSLGWDVENEKRAPQFLRTVIQEESIEVEEYEKSTKKTPDYTLQIRGTRQLFIEAKKVQVDVISSAEASFQTRRYGWSANLGISILTNFEYLIIYDCRHKPTPEDHPNVGIYRPYHFSDYLKAFDEIYEMLSFEAVNQGKLQTYFSVHEKRGITFDEHFLDQLEKWRIALANDLLLQNKSLGEKEINLLVQRLIIRIVFLRICEDREIEKHEVLRKINSYEELKMLFLASDRRYNSGIFDFIEDQLSLRTQLSSDLLIDIFSQLYYPKSPYDFAVVDANILSQIYERYLGNRLSITKENTIELINEPEVMASNGVVPTPKLIVDRIVEDTLLPIVEGKTYAELLDLRVADICCGSGTFLIGAFDYLVNLHIEALKREGIKDDRLIYETNQGISNLTFHAKKNIILNNIYGVDINPYAVDVTQFSLSLKLLEQE